MPDGAGGDVVEAPGGTGVVDEGLTGLVGGLDEGVADAAGTLLGEGEVFGKDLLALGSSGDEDSEVVLAIHALRVVQGFGVGDVVLFLVDDVGLGGGVVDDDAGTYGGGLVDTLIGDLHAGKV